MDYDLNGQPLPQLTAQEILKAVQAVVPTQQFEDVPF